MPRLGRQSNFTGALDAVVVNAENSAPTGRGISAESGLATFRDADGAGQ